MSEKRDAILIVDDERFNLTVLKDLLDPFYDIIVAKNGEQALKRSFANPPPELILLDIMMPEMDGYQVMQRLKNDAVTRDIPVIFITAMGDAANEEKGLSLGAVDYITKPFSPAVVLARVRTHLGLRHSLHNERLLNNQLVSLNEDLASKNSQLVELNKRLKDLASVDGLTGIPNRRRFDEFLLQEWKRALRDQTPLSLILMDIDFFKPFNDNYGHAEGDDCLKKVAQTLSAAVTRESDLLARYGGEEFVCVLPETDICGLNRVGNHLRDAIIARNIVHAHSKVAPHVTISMGGVAIIPDRTGSPENLIQSADKFLYKAKEQGRNRLIVE
ncbi:MAG: diguanylate cyclase [Magnetococcales bacterium]|nr:diguanylate cyclase [Magnetococcales bacterium]